MKKVKEMVVFYLALFFHSCESFSDAGYFSAITEEIENNATAAKCISNIMEYKLLLHSAVVSFVHSHDDVDYLIEMINNLEYYSIAVRSFSNINLMIDTDIYVMVTENLRQLQFGMSQITYDSFWDPRAKIIVHINNLTIYEINEVFNTFLKYNTHDVILITKADNDHDNAKIFTYHPFEDGCCGRKFNDAILVTNCNDYESVEKYFPEKPKNRLRNCNAKVLIREDAPNIIIKDEKHIGLEQYLLKTIAEVTGMTLEFKPTTIALGIVLPNRTATGLLKFLQNNEADIVAGGFILIKNRYDIFDCVYGYNFATLDVYTPDAEHAVWKKLYEEFDTETWILVILCFIVISIISTIVLRLTPKLYHSLSGLLLKLWGFFYLGNTNEHLLKDDGHKCMESGTRSNSHNQYIF
ncbi:uncharacterized protein LOC135071708 [Ostrinia nubilalis]|uniref:uncharacterized protein LOC135071708 n=1 Tax=Ostrinia nubilalis TaxID=29057 RepID=UPI0030825D88